jgi:F-type H+-transporting ATPase subunit a
MYTFLLSKIEVGSHLYVNLGENLHLHGETVIVSSIVVALITLFLVISTRDLKKVPGPLQNFIEVIYELVKSIAFTQMGPAISAIVPYQMRSQAFAMVGVYIFLMGGFWYSKRGTPAPKGFIW